MTNQVEALVDAPVDANESPCCVAPYTPPNPLSMFDWGYKPTGSVVRLDDNLQVYRIKSFGYDGDEATILTHSRHTLLEKECRPALPQEVHRRKKFTDAELPEAVAEFMKHLLGNAQNRKLLERLFGDKYEWVMTVEVPEIKRYLLLIHRLDDIRNNINQRHIAHELRYARTYNPQVYSDTNICAVLPFYNCITYAMSTMGHSGFSHAAYSNFILQILANVKKNAMENNQPVVGWSSFTDEETRLNGDNSKEITIFDPALGVSSIVRSVHTINIEQLDLLYTLCQKGLRLHTLTPLTLADDEWIDHGYVWQNKRNGEVFKKSKEGTAYYRGILLCDDTQTFRGFFSNGSCVLDLHPNSEMPEYCVYLNYGFEVEPGTTPDGDLFQYAYVPPRIELVAGETQIRKHEGSMYLCTGTDDLGNIFMKRVSTEESCVVSEKEFLEVGTIKGVQYPMWLALPPSLPIVCEDDE